jgi:hypothetical protein
VAHYASLIRPAVIAGPDPPIHLVNGVLHEADGCASHPGMTPAQGHPLAAPIDLLRPGNYTRGFPVSGVSLEGRMVVRAG